MIFEHLSAGGCQSYLVGCADSGAAALIDPEISLVDRYLAMAARDGWRIHYLIDTHTHADHFSATQQLARRLDAHVAMHRLSPAPFVNLSLDDGEMLALGKLRLQVGFQRAVALDGGVKAWREAGYPLIAGETG